MPHTVILSSEVDAYRNYLSAKMRKAVLFCSRVATVMTAALVGKPVVGVGMQMEQVANLASFERLGFAIRVGKSRDPSAKIQAGIEKLLHDDAARAEAFAGIVAKWDGPRIAAENRMQARIEPAISAHEINILIPGPGSLEIQRWRRSGRGMRPYRFFRRNSNTKYPISAEIAAIKKLVFVKISFKANAKLFPGPLVTVNSPINRLE